MTNDQTINHTERPDDISNLPLRPVPTIDGHASDDPPTDPASASNGTDRARVQPVRPVKNLDRGTKRVPGRTGPGSVFVYPAAAGPIFYAYFQTNGDKVKLGKFTTLEAADAAIRHANDMVKNLGARPVHEIVDEWVDDIAAAFSVEQRRRWFATRGDPIVASANRLGFLGMLTLDQVGKLYGVSRQRIEQLQIVGLALLRPVMGEWMAHTGYQLEHALTSIEESQ